MMKQWIELTIISLSIYNCKWLLSQSYLFNILTFFFKAYIIIWGISFKTSVQYMTLKRAKRIGKMIKKDISTIFNQAVLLGDCKS